MPEQPSSLAPEQKQRLLGLFERLLPLVDGLADKLRLLLILGLLSATWLVLWCYQLKHFSVGISIGVGVVALLPLFILARFWRAVAELKSLPDIADTMMGDAKSELQASMQGIRAGKIPKLGLFSAGRSLWSLGGMARELREVAGSYLSITVLFNPFMLILGILAIVGVVIMFVIGVVLAFFI